MTKFIFTLLLLVLSLSGCKLDTDIDVTYNEKLSEVDLSGEYISSDDGSLTVISNPGQNMFIQESPAPNPDGTFTTYVFRAREIASSNISTYLVAQPLKFITKTGCNESRCISESTATKFIIFVKVSKKVGHYQPIQADCTNTILSNNFGIKITETRKSEKSNPAYATHSDYTIRSSHSKNKLDDFLVACLKESINNTTSTLEDSFMLKTSNSEINLKKYDTELKKQAKELNELKRKLRTQTVGDNSIIWSD